MPKLEIGLFDFDYDPEQGVFSVFLGFIHLRIFGANFCGSLLYFGAEVDTVAITGDEIETKTLNLSFDLCYTAQLFAKEYNKP